MGLSRYHRFVMVFLVLPALILSGCAGPRKLQQAEERYGTDSEALSVFHRTMEGDGGLGLRFPGYLIGIEKAKRSKIGMPGKCAWYQRKATADADGLDRSYFNGNDEYYGEVKGILDDCKRSFVSHIVQYELAQDLHGLPFIREQFIHNAYDRTLLDQQAYDAGKYALLTKLKQNIRNRLTAARTQEPYTHIMVYSMGWNTDQQEALRNYNSLLYLMLQERNGRPFKPLFIGISWPSEWNWPVLETLGQLISYGTKANDADEVGMVWISQLLRQVLIPLKQEEQKDGHELPIIMVGHSFGARAITSGVFGYPSAATKDHSAKDVDLVIGLQGAFSVKRFMQEVGGEGGPYRDFKEYANKFVYTWSRHDTANTSAFWSRHIGGRSGYKATCGNRAFAQYAIKADVRQGKKCDGEFCEHNSEDLEYRGVALPAVVPAGNTAAPWKDSFADPTTISIVDATEMVRYVPYAKGGKAHSDIYTPGIANFTWDVLVDAAEASRGKMARFSREGASLNPTGEVVK
ncbi:MAG: hypothetical protein OEW15_09580 [Nitrospirota bacterium]|nr:hypothetical protein [Nitrospirota bacterium]